jgi:hypothetical protein
MLSRFAVELGVPGATEADGMTTSLPEIRQTACLAAPKARNQPPTTRIAIREAIKLKFRRSRTG